MSPRLVILFFLALFIFGLPKPSSWLIAFHLLLSPRVVLREYRRAEMTPEFLLTEVNLRWWQTWFVALLFMLPQGLPIFNRCLFIPHHEIEMNYPNRKTGRVLICFGCLYMMRIASNGDQRSLLWMGHAFSIMLAWGFRILGVPVRTNHYHEANFTR